MKKILVPVDFSENSLDILNYAGEIAKLVNAEIIVLHVIETYDQNSGLESLVTYVEDIKKSAQAKLDEYKVKHQNLWGIPLNTSLANGKIHREIIRKADEINANVIVMGTTGASRIGKLNKFIVGSNAYRVVQDAKCSVITVRNPKDPVRIKTIVVPLDLSKITEQKVETAIFLAKSFNATLHVISVWTFLDEFHKNIDRLNSMLEEVTDEIVAEGIECEMGIIPHQDIAKSVLKYAREVEADLIMIMTRQENLINEWTLGGDARKVIEKSTIPVLSLQPKQK